MKYDGLRLEAITWEVRQELGYSPDAYIDRVDLCQMWKDANDEKEYAEMLKEYLNA